MATDKRRGPAKKPSPAAKKGPAKRAPAPDDAPVKVTLRPLRDVAEHTLRTEGHGPVVVFEAPAANDPAGHALTGHTALVQALAFSPDGRWLVSGSEDRALRVWRLEDRACVAVLDGHARAVNSVCFSRDGRRLYSASDDGTVRIWNAEVWAAERVLTVSTQYVSEVCALGDDRVVTAGADGVVRVWSVATGECVRTFNHGGWVNALAASPDGALVCASNTQHELRILEVATGLVRATVKGSTGSFSGDTFARHARWSDDGARLYTSNESLVQRDGRTGEVRARAPGNGWAIQGFALLDGDRAALAVRDEVIVIARDTGAVLGELPWRHGGDTYAVEVSPDGAWIACGSKNGPVGLWPRATVDALTPRDRHVSHLASLHVGPDARVAITGGADRTARLWNLDDGTVRTHTFEAGLFISSVHLSRDGRIALAMNDKSPMHVLDTRTGRLLGVASFTNAAAYQPFLQVCELADGRWIVGSASGPLTRWTVRPLAPTCESFEGDAGHVTALAVDGAGEHVFATRYSNATHGVEVSAWSLATRRLAWRTRVHLEGSTSGLVVVGERVVALTSKGALVTLARRDGRVLGAVQVSDGYLVSAVVTGDDEVVVLAPSPARVDLRGPDVVVRYTKREKVYFHGGLSGSRALASGPEGLAVCDFARGTVSPFTAVGPVTIVRVAPDGSCVGVAPTDDAHLGAVTVLKLPDEA